MDHVVRLLLGNAARRCRTARRYLKRAERANLPMDVVEHHRGQALEAWNAFQAAKAIVRDTSIDHPPPRAAVGPRL